MAVPYTFGSATAAIPLSQLDSNFATAITLGNTAIQLGNTVTTLNNMTLANVTISSGTSNLAATAITNGTSNVTIASSGGNISMATNGTTAITIDTSQNVGIGTSSPAAKLDIGSGNLNFSSTAQRITGDFTNATVTNKVFFQTTTANSATTLSIAPSGTSTTSFYDAWASSSGFVNASYARFGTDGTQTLITSAIVGTGTYLPMTFYTGGSERVRIDTSGNVGIGTSSSGNKLVTASNATNSKIEIQNTSTAASTSKTSALQFTGTDTAGTLKDSGDIYVTPADNNYVGSNMLFYTRGSDTTAERMRIDSNGNVGIGTSSPAVKLDVAGSNQTTIARTYSGSTSFTQYIDDSAGGVFLAANTVSGTNAKFLAFQTTPSGGAATERARIDSSGNLSVGTTSSIGPSKISATQSTTGYAAIGCNHTLGSGQSLIKFANSTNSAIIGSITNNADTGVLYNVTSDQRLKENIVDAAPASSLIDSLQVRQYNWKSDGSFQRYGFIAQELVTVAPEAVHQPADPEEMMAVDYSKLVPMLVKEIQDLRKRLAALEAK